VWAGLALNGKPSRIVPQDKLQPYIDEVIEEIHFLTDPATTTWGALRSKYGRHEPYSFLYVEMFVFLTQFFDFPSLILPTQRQ
jgi:alpha-N-arabinofuranosidase